MKKKRINFADRIAMGIAVSLTLSVATASGQHASNPERINAAVKTDSKMLYHNGPMKTGQLYDYLIWYGCWSEDCGFAGDTQSLFIVTDLISNLGSTPYFQIDSTYPDSAGQAPSGVLIYGGAAVDGTYSHGLELTSRISKALSVIKLWAVTSRLIQVASISF